MIVIIGKTASGKDTIVKKLCDENDFNKIITYTTRPPRTNEINGKTYSFISQEDFEYKIHNNFFAEYKSYNSEFGKWYYGTSEESILNSNNNSIIILTPQGYSDITKKYPNVNFKCIYLYANNETIKKRLLSRGDNKEEAARRIEHDNEDFKGVEELADKIVYNNYDYGLDDVIKKCLLAIGDK